VPENEELIGLAWSCQNVDKLGVGFMVPTVWSDVVIYKDDLKFLETVADPDLVSFFKFILIAMVTRRMG